MPSGFRATFRATKRIVDMLAAQARAHAQRRPPGAGLGGGYFGRVRAVVRRARPVCGGLIALIDAQAFRHGAERCAPGGVGLLDHSRRNGVIAGNGSDIDQ
jgi:hypothetical protein